MPGRWRLQAPCPWQAFERNIDRGLVRLPVRLKHRLLTLPVFSAPCRRSRSGDEAVARHVGATAACLLRSSRAAQRILLEGHRMRCPWGGAGKAERGWGAPDKELCLLIRRHGGVRAMSIPADEWAWGMRQIQAHTREGGLVRHR